MLQYNMPVLISAVVGLGIGASSELVNLLSAPACNHAANLPCALLAMHLTKPNAAGIIVPPIITWLTPKAKRAKFDWKCATLFSILHARAVPLCRISWLCAA